MTDAGGERAWRSWAWAHGRTDIVALLDLADAVERFVDAPSPAAAARLHARLDDAEGPPPAWAPDPRTLWATTASVADGAPDDRRPLEVAVGAGRAWLASYERHLVDEGARTPRPARGPGDGC